MAQRVKKAIRQGSANTKSAKRGGKLTPGQGTWRTNPTGKKRSK
jgi:hypothetical protein